jgi:hypothetical protein
VCVDVPIKPPVSILVVWSMSRSYSGVSTFYPSSCTIDVLKL